MSDSHVYAIFSTRYAPQTGGVESFSQRLAHELVKQGNKVFVVASQLESTSSHEIQDDGVEIVRLPSRQLLGGRFPVSKMNAESRRLLEELASKQIDRVLVNNRFYRHSLEGVRFAKQIGVPVYVLDHGSAHLTFGNRFLDWFVERYEHAVTKRMMALDPHFAGISRASAAWLEHFGIKTGVVIPNAIDAPSFKRVAEEGKLAVRVRASEAQTVVAFVGRLEPEKGALEFARAARILGSDFACVMAGDGSLKSRIEDLGLNDLVLLGRVDQAELSALLGEADVFCLPTRSEGFCTSLLEAAAQGTIPVMPHVGGTDEVMGYDPVRFGVMLDSTEPEHVAQGVCEAVGMKDQAVALTAYVSENCTWAQSVVALETAFSVVES